MSRTGSEPKFFETSGTDPGIAISSSLPDPAPRKVGMTMTEHLAELRNRILICVAVLALAFGGAFMLAADTIELFKRMAPASVLFVQLTPGEVLMTSFRLSLYMAFAIASPVILYHVLRFVLPGLIGREKTIVLWTAAGGALLFAMGIVFAYFCVVPPALSFLLDFGQTVAANQISIQSYISFCSALLLVTGVMFELPMVLFLLSFTGLVTSKKLIAEWRWATVTIFIAAAIVTPSQDPLSMAMVGFAMTLLYGLSIIPIKLCGR